MVVGAGPGEAEQIGAAPIAAGQPAHLGENVGLGEAGRQVEAPRQSQRRRHHVEQLVERAQPDVREHPRQLLVGMGNEMTHSQPFFLTNGRGTTRAGTLRPLKSNSTRAPGARSGGRNARAMPWPSTGE